MEWTKTAVSELIKSWQKHECLYNTKNMFYSNRHSRNMAIDSIAQSLYPHLPGISLNEVKSKMSSLRTQYVKETNKSVDSMRSGVGAEDIYTPSVFWYDDMNFLKDHIVTRKGKCNVIVNLDGEDDDSSTPSKKQKKTCEADHLLQKATELMDSVTSKKHSYEGLLHFLEDNLPYIESDVLKDELSEKIMSLVFEYKNKQRNLL